MFVVFGRHATPSGELILVCAFMTRAEYWRLNYPGWRWETKDYVGCTAASMQVIFETAFDAKCNIHIKSFFKQNVQFYKSFYYESELDFITTFDTIIFQIRTCFNGLNTITDLLSHFMCQKDLISVRRKNIT